VQAYLGTRPKKGNRRKKLSDLGTTDFTARMGQTAGFKNKDCADLQIDYSYAWLRSLQVRTLYNPYPLATEPQQCKRYCYLWVTCLSHARAVLTADQSSSPRSYNDRSVYNSLQFKQICIQTMTMLPTWPLC
jgi:hypothetical protein